MEPISIALGLAQIAPTIAKWIGGDKAEKAAETVVGLAKTVTGKPAGADALQALEADPELALRFRRMVAEHEAVIEQAYLADRQDARARSVELARLGKDSRRPDIMIIGDAIGLIACLAVLIVFKEHLPGEAVGIIGTIAGIFGACLRDAHQFEFGSSRGSKEKDGLLADQVKGWAKRG